MGKRVNILVTAVSRRVALIRAFKAGLLKLGLEGNIVACDVDPLSAGISFCDKFRLVPLSTNSDYINSVIDVCKQESISLLIPTIDEEIIFFGKHKKRFEDIGVKIPVVDEEVGDICNDKYKTYIHFKKHNLPIAKTYLPEELKDINLEYPLFIKPRIGRGAIGTHPVNNKKELDFFLHYVGDPIVQPLLTGKEYTIDVLSDFDGKVISVVPRQRLVIRSGVSDRGITCKNGELIELSKTVAETLRLIGPSNLQCKVDDNGKATFFEVNPRFSGAIQLTIKAGADFPAMILRMLNEKAEPEIGNFEDGLTMVSYEDSIYHAPKG